MIQTFRTAILVLFAMTVLAGCVYPLAVTVIAQVAFPKQANGSLMGHHQRLAGSELIGQPFSRTEYFWGRLSATASFPYNAVASGGSNFGPLHPGLRQAAESRVAELRNGPDSGNSIPVDLVTASASGLDPHISPAAAEFQVPRIAKSRRMSEVDLRDLVVHHTEGRQLGILGEPRVNVLRLNLALDQRSGN